MTFPIIPLASGIQFLGGIGVEVSAADIGAGPWITLVVLAHIIGSTAHDH